MKLLHTDYFDVYQMHGLCSVEEVETAFGPGGVMEMMIEMKEKGIGLLCMKSMIERAWIDEKDQECRAKYPKSWCKPFDTEKDSEILKAAVKYAISLGVDTIIPPGDFDHFSFGVNHIEEILKNPYNAEDEKLLKAHLEEVKAYPFFDVE